MFRPLLVLSLLSLPALVQAGQFVLSPPVLTAGNGQPTVEVLVSYQPGPNVSDAELQLAINLDRLGWAQTQAVPAPTPDYETWCRLAGGTVTALVASRNLGALPSSFPIPLCRVRVRPHAHTPRGHYTISPLSPYEIDLHGFPRAVPANSARVTVP